MASEDLREYLEAARQRRVHEQDARKQEMAARHEARRRDFEARSEPLNVHVVRVLEGARADLAEAGAGPRSRSYFLAFLARDTASAISGSPV